MRADDVLLSADHAQDGRRVTATVGIIGYNILYLCYILFQPYVGTYYMLLDFLMVWQTAFTISAMVK